MNMDKENENATRNKKIDELLEKHKKLDDICIDIFFTLMAYKRLRFNELHRYLKKFGTDISKQSLIEHLDHLRKQKLISRKNEGFQNVSYGLTDEVASLLIIPEKDIQDWIDHVILEKDVPKQFKLFEDIDPKELFKKLSENEINEKIYKDLNTVLRQNLFELKTFIKYDLRLDRPESDAVFWNFIGNPLYRMLERSIVEDCRHSEAYKTKLLERIDDLTGAISPIRELLKEKEERENKSTKQ